MALWSKTKNNGKAGFDKLYGWVDKLGAPVNRLSNKLGSEAFWPTTMDKECDKAARILQSFCSRFECSRQIIKVDNNQRMASTRKRSGPARTDPRSSRKS